MATHNTNVKVMAVNKGDKDKYRKLLLEERILIKEQKWIKKYQGEIRKLLLQLQVEAFHLEGLINPEQKTEVIEKVAETTEENCNIDIPSVVNTRELDLRILDDINNIMKGNFPSEEEEEEYDLEEN